MNKDRIFSELHEDVYWRKSRRETVDTMLLRKDRVNLLKFRLNELGVTNDIMPKLYPRKPKSMIEFELNNVFKTTGVESWKNM